MLTFAQPLFLLALAGLAVPVLAHLINRERAQPLRFPSIRFIRKVRLPQEGRRSLRDWLLLLLRLLLYSAIVLVLAGPRWVETDEGAAAASKPRESVVVLLDLSASMSGWENWPAAKEKALEAIEALDADASVGLVLFDREVRMVLPPSTDRSTVRDFIRSAEPVPFRGNPEPALLEAASLLKSEGARRLVLVSNFQSTRWQPNRLPRLDSAIALEFVPTGDFALPNVAIMDARVFPSQEGVVRVFAQVRNFSSDKVATTVTLENGEKRYVEPIELAPGESGAVTFVLPEVQAMEGRIALPEDTYTWDNAYYLWLGAPPPTRVLVMLPMDEEPEKLIEFGFVHHALEAKTPSDLYTFAVLGGDASLSPNSKEIGHRVLYLPGAGSHLSEEQWDDVGKFLADGGLVLLTPGKHSARAFHVLRERGWSGTDYIQQTGRQRDYRNPFRIDWVNPASNLGQVFDDKSVRDLYLAEIYQYVRLRAGEKAEVLLKLEGGDPLLLREKVGRGQLIISAVPLDNTASDLPLRNAYLPILRELLVDALPRDGGVIRLDCGEPFPRTLLPPGLDPEDPMLEDLSMVPGVFNWMGVPVQVNVSRQESWPERMALSDLRAALQGGNAVKTAAAADASLPEGQALWPWFALAALLIFVAETLLAQRLKS